MRFHRDMRRSRLVVPEPKLLDIKSERLTICSRAIHNRVHKILCCGGFSVVPLEIQAHASHETLRPKQGPQHANQLRPFFINRGCVEIIDSLVRVRLHRMGCWACILSKLRVAKHRCIFNPLQRFGMKVGGEALISKHRETFFQRQLKPITTGNSITRPVVKILMPNNTFNPL